MGNTAEVLDDVRAQLGRVTRVSRSGPNGVDTERCSRRQRACRSI